MSQVYRAHSPAQVLGEAVVIAAALALLAAVQAAPVPSTTPSRGIFKAEDAVRRKPWTTLAVIAFAALAGAVVFGGGGESRDHTLPVNAALSSAASVVERAIEGAAGAAPAPERVTEADPAPSSESQRAPDATTTTGQSKDWRKASRERASRNDRRNVTDAYAYAAQTTKTKKATTVAQTRNAPAPAKDPNCNVFLPDNVFMSHHDQFRCFR